MGVGYKQCCIASIAQSFSPNAWKKRGKNGKEWDMKRKCHIT